MATTFEKSHEACAYATVEKPYTALVVYDYDSRIASAVVEFDDGYYHKRIESTVRCATALEYDGLAKAATHAARRAKRHYAAARMIDEEIFDILATLADTVSDRVDAYLYGC